MTRLEKIASLYSALTGDGDITSSEINDYAGLADTVTLEAISATLTNSSILDFSAMPTDDLLDYMFINLFGYTQTEVDALRATEAGAAGFAYWANEIANNADVINVNTLAIALLNGAGTADDAAAAAKVANVVTAYEADYPDGGGTPGVKGETFTLTDGRDNFTGTADNDTFDATAGQNQDGEIANAFATGDKLNGGLGHDTLMATVQNDYTLSDDTNLTGIRANTTNIEETRFEAIEAVTIEATRMENVEQFWSDFSDEDLTITDINLNGSNLNITKDVTFGMKDTKADAGLTATFDSQSLLKAGATQANSSLSVEIADVSTETPDTPLANVNMDLGFTLGGTAYVLENIQADGGTYAGLITAIQTALAAQGLGALIVKSGVDYTDVTVAGNTVNLPFTATELVLTDPAGKVFTNVTFQQNAIESVAGGFLVAGTALPVDPATTSTMIETNLILDNAGRGSMGGDVAIGGQSTSPIGVEKFNVKVDRDSKISSLVQSANNNDELEQKLEQIDIASMGADGSLTIGALDDELALVNATAFEGDSLTIGSATAVANLTSFNSAGSNTNVTLDVALDGSVRASDAQSFTINTGAGNDTITASLVGTSTSGSTTADLTVASSGGNNTVALSSTDAEINKAVVTTGSGVDTITGGATHLTVDTNGGNDVIYAENTNVLKTISEIAAGDFAGTAATTAMHGSTVNNIELLGNRQVQVTVDLPLGTANATAFTNGLEVTADIVASNGVLTTELDLYNAVADAINADEVINKIATASVDSNGDLKVTYTVDGLTVVTDESVEITVLGTDTDLNTTEKAALLSAVQEKYNNSTIDAADIISGFNAAAVTDAVLVTTAGVNSATSGLNVINAGLGDDVIALNTNVNAGALYDTIKFDAGQFGNDTIVSFSTAAGFGDKLDFTDWMNNKTSASGSTESQVHNANALNADGVIVAGEVTVTDFTTLAVGGGATFDDMTNAQVEAAIEAAYTTAVTTDLVGTTQNSIFMVENNANLGEYKVYQVVSDNLVGNNFTNVTLVGSLDFGESQTFDASNVLA